jgi:mono/diheme cytochrome c family protein
MRKAEFAANTLEASMNDDAVIRQYAQRSAVRWSLPGALLCGLLHQGAVMAAPPAGAELAHGEHVARLICSTCHVVAKDQEFPPILNRPTPNFVDIANRPGTSERSLEHFITNTHWDPDKIPMAMPNAMLTPEQTRAVTLYIMSLRDK